MPDLPTNHSEDFAFVNAGAVRGVVHRRWKDELGDLGALLDSIIAEPGSVLRKGGGQGLTSVKEFRGEKLYFKVYFPDLLRRRIRDLVFKPRWQREWEANCRAQAAGVHSARIVAAFGRREGLRMTHLVVTEAMPGRDIASLLSKTEAPARRLEILDSLGSYVGGLHAKGFWHAHLHCKHIFLTDAGELALIDLERSFVDPGLSGTRIERNLHQMRKSVKKYTRGDEELSAFDSAYRTALNGRA